MMIGDNFFSPLFGENRSACSPQKQSLAKLRAFHQHFEILNSQNVKFLKFMNFRGTFWTITFESWFTKIARVGKGKVFFRKLFSTRSTPNNFEDTAI